MIMTSKCCEEFHECGSMGRKTLHWTRTRNSTIAIGAYLTVKLAF